MRAACRVLLIALHAAALAAATSDTWDGGGGDNFWSTGANWASDSPLTSDATTVATFSGGTRTTSTLSADYTVNSIVFSSGCTAPFSIAMSGTRTLTFAGATPTVVQDDDNAHAFTCRWASAGDLTIDGTGSGTITFNNAFSGTGGLIKRGAFQLTMGSSTSGSSYSGSTTVLAGTLALGAACPVSANGSLGNGASTILVGDTSGSADAGLVASSNITIARDVTVQAGSSGTISLGHTFTGASNAAIWSGTVTLDRDVRVVLSTSGTTRSLFTGRITGTGGLVIAGSGVAELSNAANDFTGGVTVDGGTLLVQVAAPAGASGALGNSGSAIALGATSGTATATLKVNNGVAIGRDIDVRAGSSGTVTIAGWGTCDGAITLARNLNLAPDAGQTLVITPALTGAYAVGATGGSSTSRLVLQGAHGFTGGLSLGSGIFEVNGSIAAGCATTLFSCTLAGTGTWGPSPAQANGAQVVSLAPGSAGVGTLTFAGNAGFCGGSSTWSFDLGASSDRIVVGGNLTVDGTLNVTDSGGFAAGTYTLAEVTGTITDNGLLVGSLPAGYQGRIVINSGTAPKTVQLVVAGERTWDGGDGDDDNWTSGANWSGDVALANDASELAVFAGSTRLAPTADTNAPWIIDGLGFSADASPFAIEGNQLRWMGAHLVQRGAAAHTIANDIDLGGLLLTSGSGTGQVDLTGVVSGSVGITHEGASWRLNLTGSNTYTGITTVGPGATLLVGHANALGNAASAIDVRSGSSLLASAGITLARNISPSGYNPYTWGVDGAHTATFTGTVSLKSTTTCSVATGGTLLQNGRLAQVGLGRNLVKTGDGILVLGVTGTSHNWDGGGTVSGGAFVLNGTLTDSATVSVFTIDAGCLYAGTGDNGCGLTLNGICAPGATATLDATDNGIGTMTVGSLSTSTVTTLSAASTLALQLGTASDRLVVGGDLVLDGNLDVYAAAGFGTGSHVIATCAGTITDNGLTVRTMPAGFVGTVSIDTAPAPDQVILTVAPDVVHVTTRETQDGDGDGRIDLIRMVCDRSLDDDFNGLTVSVAGYTVTGYHTGTVDNDAEFWVLLQEKTGGDTGATPDVQVTANTTLSQSGASREQEVEGSATPATDGAKPVLLATLFDDEDRNGADAGDHLLLSWSEPVAAAGLVAGDLGLPVTGDALGSITAVTGSGTSTLVLTLGGGPALTAGGSFSPVATGDGDPSGLYVATAAHLTDAVGNSAATGSAAAAVDLGPTTQGIALLWTSGGFATRTWALGGLARTDTRNTVDDGVDLAVRNASDCTVRVRLSSGSSTSGWIAGNAIGPDRYLLKADASPATAGDPAAYAMTVLAAEGTYTAALRSGADLDLELLFQAPFALTAGYGVPQTIPVTIRIELPP